MHNNNNMNKNNNSNKIIIITVFDTITKLYKNLINKCTHNYTIYKLKYHTHTRLIYFISSVHIGIYVYKHHKNRN